MDPYAMCPCWEIVLGRTSGPVDIAPDCLPDHVALVGGWKAFSCIVAASGSKRGGFAASRAGQNDLDR